MANEPNQSSASPLSAELEAIALQQPAPEIEPSAGRAFLRGMGRGALGPLLDIYYRQIGEDQVVAAQDQLNPVAETIGQGAGLLSGILGTGGTSLPARIAGVTLGGQVAKAGKATQALLKARAGAWGETLGGRLAISGATGATEAGLVGLAEGTSAAALDREADLPGTARHVYDALSYSVPVGAGLGAFSTAFGTTANWLFKKTFARGLEKVAKSTASRQTANEQYNALLEELNDLTSGVATPRAMQLADDQVSTIGIEGRIRQIIGDPPGLMPGTKVQELSGHHVVYNPESDIVPELLKAKRALNAADQQISRTVTGDIGKLADFASERASKSMNTAASLGLGAALGGSVGGFPGMMIGSMLRQNMPEFTTKLADHIFGGLDRVPAMRRMIGRSLQAGEVTLDRMQIHPVTGIPTRLAAGEMIDDVTGLVRRSPEAFHTPEYYVQKALKGGKAIKVTPLPNMDNDEYTAIVNDIASADLGQYESQARAALVAKGIPQEAINGHITQQARMQSYLQSVFPPRRGEGFLPLFNEKLIATDEEKLQLGRRLRAAMVPESVIADFLNNDLTQEAVEAFVATHPEVAQVVQQAVLRHVQTARAFGYSIKPKVQAQIAMLLQLPGQGGNNASPELTQLFQQNFVPPQNPPTKMTGVNPGAYAPASQTGAAALKGLP